MVFIRIPLLLAAYLTCLVRLSVLASSPPASQTNGSRAITDDLTAFVNGVMADANVVGLALGVVWPDRRIEFGGFGNMTESGDPVQTDTLFAIASCTKAFTASSLGILMDEFENGKNSTPLPLGLAHFNWTTKLSQLLPDWKLADDFASEKSNLKDLLSHVTGMVGHDLSYAPNGTEEGIVRNLRNLQTPLEFREQLSYNNQMFMTAAHIIPTLSGQVYSEFAKNHIFSLLGMNDTSMSPDQAQASGKLSQAFDQHGRRIPIWVDEATVPMVAGAGGIISNVKDLTRWLQVLVNEGVDPSSNKTIIPASAFTTVTTANSILSGTSSGDILSLVGYGLGWSRSTYRGHDLVAHDGGIPGFQSYVAFLPAAKIGIVILTNSDGGAAITAPVLFRTIDSALGLEPLNFTDIANINPLGSINLVKPTFTASPDPANTGDFAGTFSNPGYGNFTLCPLTNSTNATAQCKSLIQDFARVPGSTAVGTTPQLVASWDRVWSSQLRLTQVSNDLFTLEATTLFPNGFGGNSTPFEYPYPGVAGATTRFVRDQNRNDEVKGFFACGLSGAPDENSSSCLSGDVAGAGLVWFAKN